MPYADFKCVAKDCVNVQEIEIESTDPVKCTECGGISWIRVWTPVATGSIHGAGGSPARNRRGKK